MPQISIVSIEIDVNGQKNKKSCKKQKKECIPIKRNTLFFIYIKERYLVISYFLSTGNQAFSIAIIHRAICDNDSMVYRPAASYL